jgi:rfaE bifunctional protein nucleotidyltransferase chain/domain
MRMPRVVMASGVFDLLHRGHINLLWRAKSLGDVLVVGVVSDAGTAAYKGRFPVEIFQQRKLAVEQLGFVDVVLYQQGTDPSSLLERIRPDILVHGDDWAHLKEGQATVERLGIDWVLLPYTEGISTTELRAVAV